MQAIDGQLGEYGVPSGYVGFLTPLPGGDWINQYARPKARGLYLVGDSGVGKTIAAVLIMRRWLAERAQTDAIQVPPAQGEWRFVSCSKLIMQLQVSWRRDDQDAFSILERIASYPRLVLDDLGTTRTTDYVKSSIYFILNERESWSRQTIITSNYHLDVIDEQFDPRVSSRIMGCCDVREMRGRDRRMD